MESVGGSSFESYRRKVLPIIEARLKEVVEGSELSDLYSYVVEGGKRLRPTLTLLIAEALGGDTHMALDLGCSVELTHCASLALDDILDKHDERRGKVALHRLRGLRTAVTTGFTMPSLALNLAARYGAEYPRLLTDAWVSMCMGVKLEEERPMSWGTYEKVVEMKTARLFATACLFGAKSARKRARAFQDYGLHVGRAFQMADDLADGTPWNGRAFRERLEEEIGREVQVAVRATHGWRVREELLEALREAPTFVSRLKKEGS